MRFTSSKCNRAEHLLVISFSQSMTDLLRDLGAQAVMSQGLIEVVDERAGDQQVIHDDGLLSHRGITGAKDGSTRGVVLSLHTTREDELHGLTVPQGAVLHGALSNTSGLVGFEHFATEQFQVQGVLITSDTTSSGVTLGQAKLRVRVNRTNRSRTRVRSATTNSVSSHYFKEVDICQFLYA